MDFPTDRLMAEHRNIERMLDVVEEMCLRLKSGKAVAAADQADSVTFIRDYADKLHHGKEEDILFGAMEAAGFPRNGGPTGVMIMEHEQGRGYVGAMAAGKDFAVNGLSYVGLLRQHIRKEDECLYPMANERLTPEQQKAMDAAFRQVDEVKIGPARIAELLGILERLEKTYRAVVR